MRDWSEVKCCFCGRPLWNGHATIPEKFKSEYFGNNPWPLSDNENDRCCDECNDYKVIPERIRMAFR